ncbi:hypothetical protein NK6_1757 [Bradyrhizobium diazoefficiens]|uniref:Uncharacterized protein n=1 Tax=Bradyrhizobium diazoefficiens TaxID=1355477 RepID=A0A0E4FRS7_9BRAD|nr:hypothetical protein NK6_1757 [Bradyrhizobium diazoefficiens]
MIGTVFASPQDEINKMEIHIGGLGGPHLLHSTPNRKRIHGARRRYSC